MPAIHCLHTADVHRATFTRLFAEADSSADLVHTVRPEWLAGIAANPPAPALADTVARFLASAAAEADAVLCTCSSLGPIATSVGRRHCNVVRIDAPMMAEAARRDGVVVLLACLGSAAEAAARHFDDARAATGGRAVRRVVVCDEAWPLFVKADTAGFAAAIAARAEAELAADERVGCIVLAQASMAVAEPLLSRCAVPVLTSPERAVAETLRVAQRAPAHAGPHC